MAAFVEEFVVRRELSVNFCRENSHYDSIAGAPNWARQTLERHARDPRQWHYAEDELTDRSEKFLASETVREKLFRLTGDELPYTSTVIIDKFEEEGNLRRIAATIVVERDSHKGIVIGNGGE